MKNTRIIFSIFFSVLCSIAQAQKGETKVSINYNVALPMNDFKNVVSSTSFRGFNASILHGFSDNVSVGFASGFQDFYQKNGRQLYHFSDGTDVSAVVTNTIQTIPLLADVKYNFSPGGTVQPYVAAGAGGNLITYNQMFGEFGNEQTKFRFAARPEAGLFIPLGNKVSGFDIGVSYSIMPFNQGDIKNLNSLGIHAGLSLPLRK